jgi:hypothetical protein
MLAVFACTTTFSQQSNPVINVAPNAPKDKPKGARAEEISSFEEAIKPYIEMAKKSYPEAKERFRKGLPPKHTFFITTRLHDAQGRLEQVFIAVREISDAKITGLIWSDINLVAGYRKGDSYTFPETELIDWTISKPDGTEEGNFVGKFLDTYQPQTITEATTWRTKPATPERMNQRIEESALKYQSNAPIPRIVLYDIGYPRNDEEYNALDGNAVMLITALAQTREELPVKRVYVLVAGKEVELSQLKLVLSEQTTVNGAVAKTFGAFRMDALYLLPMILRMRHSDLLVDFAQTRTGMKVAVFGTPLSAEVSKLTIKDPTGIIRSRETMDEFIRREFPSFFSEP